jgi:3-oxoacyl-[acyl-carrier-protein] synthase III
VAEVLAQPAASSLGASPRGAAVGAVGTALPPLTLPNAVIAERLGVSESRIESRTGVRERRVAAEDATLAGLAETAGRAALARAGIAAEALDLVIVASFSQDDLMPGAAPVVAHALGATHAGAFDVGAACAGFLTALAVATAQVEAGRADHALVIGADLAARFTDPGDRRTAPLFGDGAGAVVVGPTRGPGRVGPACLGADGSGAAHIYASRAEGVMRMDGHETFKAAVTSLCRVSLEALEAAGLTIGDVDLFVYHQANARILAAVGDRLGLPPQRVVNAIGSLGNTSAASIPLALAEAERDGKLADGTLVLLGAFGAGFTWGAMTLTWGRGDG